MTKRYKLIKEYPGSPNTYIDKIYSIDELSYGKWIDEYPEFWQEVKEPTFEILSYTNNDSAFKSKINSVKRLPDGEIFTIGDEIKTKAHDIEYRLNEFLTVPFCIKSFELIDNICIIHLIENYKNTTSCGTVILKNVTKVVKKQLLFITEDGIEIFGGDIYFSVHYSKFCGVGANGEVYPTSDSCSSCGHWIPFSTKQKAEEYIIMNKPCLSLKDVLLSTARQTRVTQKITNELKRIIKARI